MRILTGIQPSGIPHLGNYFGAMRQVCNLQEKGESFLFIADYHALTTNPDPQQLRERIMNLALDFLACGVDTGFPGAAGRAAAGAAWRTSGRSAGRIDGRAAAGAAVFFAGARETLRVLK